MVTRVTADLDCRIVLHRQHYCEHWNCYWVIFNWTQKLVQELLSGNGKSALLNSVNEKEMVERHFCHFCSWRLQCSILIHTFIISSWLVMFSLLPIGPKYSINCSWCPRHARVTTELWSTHPGPAAVAHLLYCELQVGLRSLTGEWWGRWWFNKAWRH